MPNPIDFFDAKIKLTKMMRRAAAATDVIIAKSGHAMAQ